MIRKLSVLYLFIIILSYLAAPALAQDIQNEAKSSPVEGKKLSAKAKVLSLYLEKHNSPLQNHSQDFIDAAEAYQLDWKMLPAIAGVESTFGKRIPGGYNAWGWGVYGNQAIFFSSWKEGMFAVAKGLRENYINKGLTNPYSMNRIYAASPHWGSKVSYFMEEIAKFSQTTQTQQSNLPSLEKNTNIAALSASLNTR